VVVEALGCQHTHNRDCRTALGGTWTPPAPKSFSLGFEGTGSGSPLGILPRDPHRDQLLLVLNRGEGLESISPLWRGQHSILLTYHVPTY